METTHFNKGLPLYIYNIENTNNKLHITDDKLQTNITIIQYLKGQIARVLASVLGVVEEDPVL